MSDDQCRFSWMFHKVGQPLTRQEHHVLQLMSRGATTREIATLAGVGPNTVKFHLKNLYGKLGARRRTQAVMLAQRQGILPVAGTAGSLAGDPGRVRSREAGEYSASCCRPKESGSGGSDMPFTREPSAPDDGFDTRRRYVRITRRRPDGFVEFEFALGEPGISIDMVLGCAAFEEFCANNRVVPLDPEAEDSTRRDCSLNWHPRDATRRRFGDA